MLKTQTVGTYTCTQFGPLQAIRMRNHLKNVDALKITDPDMLSLYQEWAFLACCTEPFIPWEKYIDTPVDEMRPMNEAVAELNAGLDENSGPPSKKKLSGKQPKSTTK